MPRPRKALVSLETTSYYHCVSRCVRRAFLCGEDAVTGRSFEHRRQWIESRLLKLADIFAIDVAAFAIMHNHYHVVLHINRERGQHWPIDEVINRWHQLFKGCQLSQRFQAGELLAQPDRATLEEIVELWRQRLMSISWFMRCANEPIAREANREDDVTGRFWEGRFKSQALLDDKALLACMTYVDLNPVRAKVATTPETSRHTSIGLRIKHAAVSKISDCPDEQPSVLLAFTGNSHKNIPDGLPFSLQDYLTLVDWSGRILREEKRGSINENAPAILQRLNMDPRQFIYLSRNFESRFKHLVGAAHRVQTACHELGIKWAHGINRFRICFNSR